MYKNAIISTFHPFNTISICVSADATLDDFYESIYERIPVAGCVLARAGGKILHSLDGEEETIFLRLTPRMNGGKGGFGSQLRAAGGRMSSGKNANRDMCRDLSGRRLGVVKTAKKLAEYEASAPEREAERQKRIREKIEEGLNPRGTKKTKFDDHQFFNEKEELIENAKNAVIAGLRRKKKAKKSSSDDTISEGVDKGKANADKPSSIAQAVTAH